MAGAACQRFGKHHPITGLPCAGGATRLAAGPACDAAPPSPAFNATVTAMGSGHAIFLGQHRRAAMPRGLLVGHCATTTAPVILDTNRMQTARAAPASPPDCLRAQPGPTSRCHRNPAAPHPAGMP